ncbi:MAG: hypothetical protein AAF591_11865 [Verrucomicrobiota bacterium]
MPTEKPKSSGRSRRRSQAAHVDAKVTEAPAGDSFVHKGEIGMGGEDGGGDDISSKSSIGKGAAAVESKGEAALEINGGKSVQDVTAAAPTEEENQSSGEDIAKNAILARLSQSVREIESRSTVHGAQDEAGEGSAADTRSEVEVSSFELPSPSEGKESEKGAATKQSLEGEREDQLEKSDEVLGGAATRDFDEQSSLTDRDELLDREGSWQRKRSRVARRDAVPYGKIFLLCFLIPLMAIFGIGLLAKGAIRSFFVGEAGEQSESSNEIVTSDAFRLEAEALEGRVSGLEEGLKELDAKIAESIPNVGEEIEYLQMRNRLTSYADEAITMANRSQYEKLWDVVYDEGMTDYHAAAVSEILRVKFFYASGSRLGAWTLPVRDLFPGLETEGDLQVQQVIDLLLDRTQDWRVRVRAARLLEGQRTRRVMESLRDAIHDDPNLDVLKEAVRTFEVNGNFVGEDFFDVESVDAWWEVNSSEFDVERE